MVLYAVCEKELQNEAKPSNSQYGKIIFLARSTERQLFPHKNYSCTYYYLLSHVGIHRENVQTTISVSLKQDTK